LKEKDNAEAVARQSKEELATAQIKLEILERRLNEKDKNAIDKRAQGDPK